MILKNLKNFSELYQKRLIFSPIYYTEAPFAIENYNFIKYTIYVHKCDIFS